MRKLILVVLGSVCVSCAVVPIHTTPMVYSTPTPSAPSGTLVCHRPHLQGEQVLLTAKTHGSYTASVKRVVKPYLHALGATVVEQKKFGYSLELRVANESDMNLRDMKILKIHLELINPIGESLANGVGVSTFYAGSYSYTYFPAVEAATMAAMNGLCTHITVVQ